MGEQKYYWLKLKRDFFKRHDIQIIEAMPNGKEYVLFYLKLMMESIDHEGELRFSETIPYNEQMLSVITNTNVDIVRSAMQLLKELHMVEILDDATIYMNEVQKMVGSESAGAERVRKHREKKALEQAQSEQKSIETSQSNGGALHCNGGVTKCNTEIDKEIDIDIYNIYRADTAANEPKKDKPKQKRFVPPTVDEVAAYCTERKNGIDAQQFVDYYSSQDWRRGKGIKLTDWRAAVRTWERNGVNAAKQKPPDIITNDTVYDDIYR